MSRTLDVVEMSIDDAIRLAELSDYEHSLPAFRIYFEPTSEFPNPYSLAKHLYENPLRQKFYLPLQNVVMLRLPVKEFFATPRPGNHWLDTKFLTFVLQCFPNLRGFVLHGNSDYSFQLTDSQIRSLVDNLPNVRHLALDGFPHRDNVWREWRRLKKLESLVIDSHGTEDLSRLDLYGLISELPSIKRLILINETLSALDLCESNIMAIREEIENLMSE